MNLMMLLEMAAGGFGERVAIGPRDGGLTYQRLYDLAGTASRRFRDAGVEHVAMADVSSEALPIALFGAAWSDLPFVPLNYRLTDEELAALAGRIAPAITVLDPDAPGRLDGVCQLGRPTPAGGRVHVTGQGKAPLATTPGAGRGISTERPKHIERRGDRPGGSLSTAKHPLRRQGGDRPQRPHRPGEAIVGEREALGERLHGQGPALVFEAGDGGGEVVGEGEDLRRGQVVAVCVFRSTLQHVPLRGG